MNSADLFLSFESFGFSFLEPFADFVFSFDLDFPLPLLVLFEPLFLLLDSLRRLSAWQFLHWTHFLLFPLRFALIDFFDFFEMWLLPLLTDLTDYCDAERDLCIDDLSL